MRVVEGHRTLVLIRGTVPKKVRCFADWSSAIDWVGKSRNVEAEMLYNIRVCRKVSDIEEHSYYIHSSNCKSWSFAIGK